MSRRTIVNLAFFGCIFVVMCFWAVNNIVTIDAIEQPYTVTGDFAAASGIKPNAEVAYLGVHYGRVSAVDAEPGGVRITMKIDKDKTDIPKDSIARIFRKSAVGEPYIDFKPPDGFDAAHAPPSAFLADGDHVPRDHTSNPLEFSELLRSAANLLHNIDAQQAGSLVHELALALNGRAESLRDLTVALDRLSTTFAQKTEALDRLATNNTAVTHVVASHAQDLGQSLTNLSLLAESLKQANGNTAVLLDQGSALMTQLADLIDAEKGNLDCTLHDLADVIDMSSQPQRLVGTDFLLGHAAEGFGDLWQTRDQLADGLWVRVNLMAELSNPAVQYVPPHALPIVPAVPPCTSGLAGSHGPDFVPADVAAATTRTTAALPGAKLARTGRATLLPGAFALVLLATISRRVIHATRRRT